MHRRRRLTAPLFAGSTFFVTAFLMTPKPSAALLWQDEFNQPAGTGPDPAKWTHDLGQNGWGNAELENYTDSRENSFARASRAYMRATLSENRITPAWAR